MDARMDEVYAANYRLESAHWRVASAPALYTVDALAARWRAAPPQAVAGSAVSAFSGRLPLVGALLVPRALDRAGALLALALRAFADGAAIDPAQALPLYLRDKVALTSAERAALQTTTGGRRG
jgi:tRNA threonylcarbamoyladenosine biosynthesis protein TsaB